MCLHLDGEMLVICPERVMAHRSLQRKTEEETASLSCFPPAPIKATHHLRWHRALRASDKPITCSINTDATAALSLCPSSDIFSVYT